MEAIIPLVLIGIYFLPTIIASNRKHNNLVPVFAINLWLGWTGIGWFVALVWSTTDNVKRATT